MEPTEYVKIRFFGQMNYVKITKHENTLQYQDFLLSASMYANISCLDIDYFTDSQDVRIFEEQFMDIFDRFKNHPEFYLKIVMKNNKSEENETQTLGRQNCRMGHDMFISAQDLEDYIIKNKNAFLLCKKYKENERSKFLSDMERRAVVRDCVDFLTEKHSHHPDSNQLNALALSAVKLFPQLKTSNVQTGGIDALYDRKSNRGFLISRLNRVRQKLYSVEKGSGKSSRKRNTHEDQKLPTSTAELEQNENFLILKNLNTITQKEFIKQKLKETLNERINLFKIGFERTEKYSQQFPFFFTSPDLILYDFDLRHPKKSNLVSKWNICSPLIADIFQETKGINFRGLPELDDLLPSMKTFFLLLNVLPQVVSGKASANCQRESFTASVNKIITFKQPNLTKDELLEGGSIQPYIIAEGHNKLAISTYYLCIENELIILPPDTHEDQKLPTSTAELEQNENFLILKNLNTITQKEFIKQKLKETLNERINLFKIGFERTEKYSQQFPFFFTSPDLILYDFDLRHPKKSNLVSKWNICSPLIADIFQETKGINFRGLPELDDLLPSMKTFFLLLNVLPQVVSGKASANCQRESFTASVNKIITFKQPNLTKDELLEGGSIQPYIIAEGHNKLAISTYYLCIENELIILPPDTSFIECMDVLFKSHYVFEQHFEANLKTFWTFISHYFYGLEEKKLTSRIREKK